jgi:hypothetical protein
MVFFIFSVDFFCFVMAIFRGRLLVMDLLFVVGFKCGVAASVCFSSQLAVAEGKPFWR